MIITEYFCLLQYLTDRVAMYMHAYTLYSAVRPYGCGVIFGTYEKTTGPEMFMVDPSGVFHVIRIKLKKLNHCVLVRHQLIFNLV
jgi:20S proteasome alpha/beta subunit